MGFGSTAKKLQKVTEMADKLYERFERLREQVNDLTGTVEETNDRVATLETQLAEQRALLEALADERGVDVDAVVADVDAGAEADGTSDEGGDTAGETSESVDQSGDAAGKSGDGTDQSDGRDEAVTDAGSGSVDGNA